MDAEYAVVYAAVFVLLETLQVGFFQVLIPNILAVPFVCSNLSAKEHRSVEFV